MTDILFTPLRLNERLTLNNRILMAPLTRCMAGEGLVPTQQMADYYGRRADAGLIISEATIIRPDAQGYPNTPGIFTQAQIAGWRLVTDAVHEKGGKIFAQLWHTGRVAHPHFWGGTDALAPSAVGIKGTVPRMRELSYVVPREATVADIAQLVEDYAKAAENAIEAGFDGVEIHGANGYLIDEFLHHDTNRREDEFGGNPQNMIRFPLQVVDSIIARIGANHTALRISPAAYFNIQPDARDRQVFDLLLAELDKRELAYLHGGIFDDSVEYDYLDGKVSEYLRRHTRHTLVGVGGYSADSAAEAIADDRFELIAIGRPFIANHDYVARVREGKETIAYSDEQLPILY
ncbi:alkene reductase [Shewanella sp.]|uniref:alkene reductase n=1 Tax=Shewanella sp. TaxID=50422 RepID=UPI003565CC2E